MNSNPKLRAGVQVFLCALAFAVAAALAVLVWSTAWRYDRLTVNGNTFPIRVNRFNGQTEILRGMSGWVQVDSESDTSHSPTAPPAAPPALPPVELGKLDGRLSVTNYGWIEADVYNGTARSLGEVRVRLVISNANGGEALNREYSMSSSTGEPLSSSKFIANCGCRLEKGQSYAWSFTSANWR
jgi:hypothetical protein